MSDANQKTKTNINPERIIIRISDTIPRPPVDNKIQNLAKTIDTTTGQAEKSNSDQKIIDEAARKLWRLGTDPSKLEFAIKQSSVTLSEKDKEGLLKIAGELKKLHQAYPVTSKKFLSQIENTNKIEIKDTPDTEAVQKANELVLEKTARGIQVSPSEYQSQEYDPEDLKESDIYLDNLSQYAQDLNTQEVGPEYQEPETAAPSLPTTSRTPSMPSFKDIRSSLSRGRGAIVDEGKRVASNAIKSARSAANKLIKQGLSKLSTAAAPVAAKGALVIAAATALLLGFLAWLATVIITVLLWMIGFIVFVAIILFIINSGAYMVPPGKDLTTYGTGIETPGNIPPGGILTNCTDPNDITQDLANRISNGSVYLLPNTNGARIQHLCFIPVMVILHTSGGYDNNTGNISVYNTLAPAQRQASCNMASDTDDVILMQPFYDTMVEESWCSNGWNYMGISIEISGECDDAWYPQPCMRNNSACQVGPDSYPYTFQPPGSSATHPCPNENNLTFSAVCEVMKQYNIPWCQVWTHDDVPNQGHTDPVGKGWVTYFKQRLRSDCHVPADSQCS